MIKMVIIAGTGTILFALFLLWVTGFFDTLSLAKLKKTGLRGRAEILAIGPISGHASNYMVTISLQVTLPGRSPYVVDTLTLVPQEKYQPVGTVVPVWVDPAKSSRILVDWDDVKTARDKAIEKYGKE